jgi:hypothetical protein
MATSMRFYCSGSGASFTRSINAVRTRSRKSAGIEKHS